MSLINLLEDADLKKEVYRKVKKYAAGEVIVEENSPGSEFFVIYQGQVHIVTQVQITAEDSEEIEIAKLVEGDFFGEIALFKEDLRCASVIAETDCEIVMFDGGALLDFMEARPEQGYKIIRHLFEVLLERVRMNNLRASTIMGFYKREAG